MDKAMKETQRRREKQQVYNKEHNITPTGIKKKINDIMEGAYPGAPQTAQEYAKAAEEMAEYEAMTPAKLAKKIKALEQQMFKHSQNLEFE